MRSAAGQVERHEGHEGHEGVLHICCATVSLRLDLQQQGGQQGGERSRGEEEQEEARPPHSSDLLRRAVLHAGGASTATSLSCVALPWPPKPCVHTCAC